MSMLRYGDSTIEVPGFLNGLELIEKQEPPELKDINDEIERSLSYPIGTGSLKGLFGPNDSVSLIISDITRYTGADIFLPVILRHLRSAGIKKEQIKLIFSNGIHRAMSDDEMKTVLREEIFNNYRIYQNNSRNKDYYETIVKINGTNIKLMKEVLGTKIILTGTISFHYLAGFGGGGKSILPGIASYESCVFAHKKTLAIPPGVGRHEKVYAGNLEGNPFYEIICKVTEKINPIFLFNTAINSNNKITGIFAGHWRDAHLQGCQFIKENYFINLRKKADVVVVSCGGYPKDINFIQTHKTLENIIGLLKEGGTVLLISECRNEVGCDNFLDWFKNGSIDDFDISLRSNFEIYGQTAMSAFLKTKWTDILFYTELDHNIVKQMGMIPIKHLDDAKGFLLEKRGKDYKGYIIPNGAAFFYNVG